MGMYHNDDTQPIQAVTEPAASLDDTQPFAARLVTPPDLPEGDDEASGGYSGPGCLIWGVMAAFSLALATAIVMLAGFAGWTTGLQVAQANATTTQDADIRVQCDNMRNDIEAGNAALLQRRIDELMKVTPAVACIESYAPTATALYINSLPTATPTATETPTITPTLESSTTQTAVTAEATVNTMGFDLDALLAEAQAFMTDEQYSDAIDTLDAVIAIDENYRKTEVELMLFNALTARANRLYREGVLAEANVLVDRAKQFGDVGPLNYEQAIAEIYLDAERYQDVNYQMAIRLLAQIVYDNNLPNYNNGEASRRLFQQYIAFGDALALGGEPCLAVQQYEAVLASQPERADVKTKRDSAQQACSSGVTVGTPDPSAPASAASPTPAPLGVQ